jgi:hypothetical protein
VAMKQMGQVSHERNAADQAKRVSAAVRCMAIYQQGLLFLRMIRQNGHQRITVQYVNVSHGSQAVIGNIDRNGGGDVDSHPSRPTR